MIVADGKRQVMPGNVRFGLLKSYLLLATGCQLLASRCFQRGGRSTISGMCNIIRTLLWLEGYGLFPRAIGILVTRQRSGLYFERAVLQTVSVDADSAERPPGGVVTMAGDTVKTGVTQNGNSFTVTGRIRGRCHHLLRSHSQNHPFGWVCRNWATFPDMEEAV